MIKLLISEPSLILKAKLNEYTQQVIEEKDEFNYCVFDFEETPLDEIIDTLQSPSFSSEKKVVVCKNPYFIKDGKIKNGFVFFEDGRVMKQVNVEGIKAEDFRIQNLALLSDNEIESLNLRATMDVVNQNITSFKSFVAGKVQAKSDKKARRKAELIQKAERKEQRLERRIEKEK